MTHFMYVQILIIHFAFSVLAKNAALLRPSNIKLTHMSIYEPEYGPKIIA